MAEARNRLLRRRLLLLSWAADTREEAQRLSRNLDQAHPVAQHLLHVAQLCGRLQELLSRPADL